MAAKREEEVSKPSIGHIIAGINRKAGSQIIQRVSKMESLTIPRISTGLKELDDALGGGIPKRRITELYGFPSGGKSLIALLTIAQAQREGKDCVWIDAEGSFDPEWAKKLGVNVDELILSPEVMAEDVLTMVLKLLPAEPDIIVVDSIAATITREEHKEQELDKAFMAKKARLMSKALPKITIANKNTAIIFINQMRSTMNPYGASNTTPGGNALPHYASIRCEVKRGDGITEAGTTVKSMQKDWVGNVVQVRVKKNKTAPPFRKASFKLFYDGRVE